VQRIFGDKRFGEAVQLYGTIIVCDIFNTFYILLEFSLEDTVDVAFEEGYWSCGSWHGTAVRIQR
jgi:hypothetical protein